MSKNTMEIKYINPIVRPEQILILKWGGHMGYEGYVSWYKKFLHLVFGTLG